MRSMFASFPTEKVRLIKQDKTVVENIEALVDKNHIFIDDATVDIEEGDIFERDLPTGKSESYLVIDRGFYRAMGGIPAHYQVLVQKQTNLSKPINEKVVNNYNISGAEKININSTDNSVTYNITENDIALMEMLKALAKELENSTAIIDSIEEMKNNVGKKSFAEKYNTFIQSVANHMTIFAPFIPALTQLLTK